MVKDITLNHLNLKNKTVYSTDQNSQIKNNPDKKIDSSVDLFTQLVNLPGRLKFIHKVRRLKKEASKGNGLARLKLGVMYHYGQGVKQNINRAIFWYQGASVQGVVTASYYLGLLYNEQCELATGEPQDSSREDNSRIVYWFKKSADRGYAPAQHKMGILCEQGKYVPRNEIEAVNWYKKSAAQDYASAQCNLGRMYDNGSGGLSRDKEQAAAWYLKAARQGDVVAQFNLGALYGRDEDIHLREEISIHWYEAAANQGYAPAQYNLGKMYEIGLGVKKNKRRAIQWYQKAAEQGYVMAQQSLDAIF